MVSVLVSIMRNVPIENREYYSYNTYIQYTVRHSVHGTENHRILEEINEG